jgi:tetratricopeptide (TPR) repeat protein
MLKDYAVLRQTIRKFSSDMDDYHEELQWMNAAERKKAKPPVCPKLTIPANLPREFELYLRGAVAWHADDIKSARKSWLAVMDLPGAQRKYRTVWAAYMLGRSYVKENPPQAIKRFKNVRKLVTEGFADSLGLSAASLGWEGRAELNRKDYCRAIELYMLQHKSGSKSAAASLRVCAARILRADENTLVKAAKHELSRRVITAHLVAGRSHLWMGAESIKPEQTKIWLAAVTKSGVKDVRGADRMGWAAYRAGQMKSARHWVSLAPADAPIAQWIRAKLLLRDGKLDQAAAMLAKVVRKLPKIKDPTGENKLAYWSEHSRRVAGSELAVLKMSRRQYVEAMDLLSRYNWAGAGYIAERVLTVDELTKYIDNSDEPGWLFCSILARRLARMGRWKQAKKYFSLEDCKILDEYIQNIRDGNDSKRSKAKRAESFWKAATIAHDYGVDLMGYATANEYGRQPDGTFHLWHDNRRTLRPWDYKAAPVTTDERKRTAKHRPKDPRRWHYLYEAAGHAWSACELMPDELDKTARRLCEAGTWLKYGNPDAADRFYKAMVIRCGSTKLGQQADKLRWFPKLPKD